MPWDGKVRRGGICYPGDACWRLIVLQPIWTDTEFLKCLYVRPLPGVIGETLRRGTPVATVQDLRKKYPGITPHVHFERWGRIRGVWVRKDPAPLLLRAA